MDGSGTATWAALPRAGQTFCAKAADEASIGHPSSGPPRRDPRTRVLFLHLGSSGNLGQFTVQLARAAIAGNGVDARLALARTSRSAARFEELGIPLVRLDTFEGPFPGPFSNFLAARKKFLAHLDRDRPDAVVTVMPHIWTPLLAPAIKRIGISYVSVAHDAVAHPGDPTAILTPWLLQDARHADRVITLSHAVTDRLVQTHRVPAERIVSLFHPDLLYGDAPAVRQRRTGSPLRLLFFGRIFKYKGLPLLLDAVEALRAEGLAVQLGVAGTGNIGRQRGRLAALSAEIINRWVEDNEIAPLFARYDAVALSHIEASQSGVAAIAFGNRMPVVAVPVGGLVEQVDHGRTGILAQQSSAASFAEAIRRLALDTSLYNSISTTLATTAADRSMHRFVTELTKVIAGASAASARRGMARAG